MPSFTVTGVEFGSRTLFAGETGTVTAAGSLALSGGTAIVIDLTGAATATTTIDNSGTISSPSASPIAIVGNAVGLQNIQIFNRAGATLGGYAPSLFTMAANLNGGTFSLENAGTLNGNISLFIERDVITSTGTINGGIDTGGGNDSITLGGLAVVTGLIDGGAGIDSLTANYSGAAYHPDFVDRTITSNGGSFAGTFYSNVSQSASWLRFQSIEQLALTFGSENDQVVVNLGALANGATIALDGGTGSNRLFANFAALGSTSFVLAANGTIASNQGSFARFQGFDLTLGGGTNTVGTGDQVDTVRVTSGTSTIATGANNDVVISSGSAVVTFNGGADYDSWEANYAASAAGLSFTFDGASASLSNGSTATGVESIQLKTGSGNDSVSTTGGSLLWNAGTGSNSLTLNYAGRATAPGFSQLGIGINNFDPLSAQLYADGASFGGGGVSNITAVLSDGDDIVTVKGGYFFSGGVLSLDGGLGSNTLVADFAGYSGLSLILGAGGTITSNRGSYARFTAFDVTLGGGTNIVTTGAADDTFRSSTGADTINGGAGLDSWTGAYQTASAMSFAFTGNAATLVGGAGTTSLSGIESMTVVFGAGADSGTVTQAAAIRTDLDGGGGNDSLTINLSSLAADGQSDFSQIYSNPSGFIGYAVHNGHIDSAFTPGDLNVVYFSAFEHLTAVFGADQDVVTVYAPYTRSGQTLAIDGGGGIDILDLGGAFSFSVTPGALGGFVINDTDPGNGDFGTFTVRNFEYIGLVGGIALIEGTGGADTLSGTSGDDVISGGAGDDAISGGAGNDTLYGGSGADVLIGGVDADRLIGGDGDDTYLVDEFDTLVEDPDQGFDTVSASVDWTLGDNFEALKLNGSANLWGTGNALDNVIRGNSGDNVLIGHGGDDKLRGGAGVDQLFGEDGADQLFGGLGNDDMFGGTGSDRLIGGDGADNFWIDSIEVDGGFDTLTDFVHGTDKIALVASLFTGISGATVAANEFRLGTAATTGNHRLIYDQASGSLWYDEDGVGGVDQILIAQLSNLAVLSRTDFFLG